MFTNRLLRTGLSLAGLLGLVACGTDSTSFVARDAGTFGGTLSGKMVDRTGKALPGTLVIASPGGHTTVTAPDGNYEFASLPAGAYRVAAAREDFRDTALTDSVKLGLLEIRPLPALGLTFRYATIRGTVTDSNGMASTGAGVAVQNQTAQTQSAQGGAFVLGRVEPGRIKLFAALPGVGYGILDTVVSAQDTLHAVPLRIARKGGTVTGTIVDANLVPMAGATVTALGGALKATTDRDGRFALRQVPGVGSVGLTVARNGIEQSVSGVRVPEGGRIDLDVIAPGTAMSGNEAVSVSNGLVFAFTSDSLVTVVADTSARDTSFHILRWLWSRDGLKSWDTTSTNVWKRSLSVLGWGVGDHPMQVCAFSMNGVLTSAVTQTVRVRLPPDTTAPSVARVFPLQDTTYLWRDSLVTVAWSVSDERHLDSVLINGVARAPSSGVHVVPLTLRPGANLAFVRTVDRSGNGTLDTLRLTLGARGAYDSSLASLKVTTTSGTLRSLVRPSLQAYSDTVSGNDTSITVKALAADSTDTVWINGIAGNQLAVPLDVAGKVTTVTVQVRAFDGDTLDYVLRVFRKPIDSTYGIPWKYGVAYGQVLDSRDGKSYRTVNVGGRNWMAQNLDHSKGGTVGTCYNAALGATTSGPADTCAKYGRLYTWAEAMGVAKSYNAALLSPKGPVQGVCPAGWHVPADTEWDAFATSLGGLSGSTDMSVSSLLQALSGWNGSVTGIDTLGFRALPAGDLVDKVYGGIGAEAYFWSSSEGIAEFARDRYLSGTLSSMGSLLINKSSSISLRCVQDLVPAHDTTLERLVLVSPSGTGLKGFDPSVQSYVLAVGTDDSTVTVTAVASDTSSTVSIAGMAGTKWTVELGAVGSITPVLVKVLGTDGDVLIYTVNVSRTGLDSTYGIPWNASVKYGALTDSRDGQTYRTVTVGKQTWMAQNLNIQADSSWCPTGSIDSCGKYGRLYSWTSARALSPTYDTTQLYDTMTVPQGICPKGWHLPSNLEWNMLTSGGLDSASAGILLKSTSGWTYLGNGSDSLGLRILPAGERVLGGYEYYRGEQAFFWSATQGGTWYAWDRQFFFDSESTYPSPSATKRYGFSVRCVMN